LIESIGLPHTEVGDIIVNGDCVDNTIGVSDQEILLLHKLPISNIFWTKIKDITINSGFLPIAIRYIGKIHITSV